MSDIRSEGDSPQNLPNFDAFFEAKHTKNQPQLRLPTMKSTTSEDSTPGDEVQIILAGPPDDACGLYAGTLLDQLGPLAAWRVSVGFGMGEFHPRSGAMSC